MSPLTPEQLDALDAMVTRRMNNTGESRKQASVQVAEYLEQRLKIDQAIDDLND